MKHFLLIIPPWNRKLLVVVGTDKTKVLSFISRHKLGQNLRTLINQDPVGKGDEGATYMDLEKGRYVLWLPKWANTGDDMDTLVHEVNHIVKHLMKHIGATGEYEANAYTNEWLFSTIRKKLKAL